MASNARTPITLIEFGTDKICVLHGRRDEADNAEVIAFAQAPSEGSVRKGMIVDYDKAMKILGDVLERADRSVLLKGEHKNVYFLLNGSIVSSLRGEGTVMIYGSDCVKREHMQDAIDKAHGLSLPAGVVSFSSYDGFFVLNRNLRVKDPIGQPAQQLDAYVHIMTAEQKSLEAIRMMIRSLGFENAAEPVFNGIASAFAVLHPDEREQGVLLVDFGLGCCDYVLICAEGVYLSGVLSVGVSHVANDLSIGLDLPYDFCLKFLMGNQLSKLRAEEKNYLEYTASVTGKKRRIPLDSFERIMQLRLREIFTIIHGKVREKNLMPCMTSGAVLCGGGALIEGAIDTMKSVFSSPVRLGEPLGISGSKAGLDYPPTCYSAILGLLKYAIEDEAADESSGMDLVRDALNGVAESVIGKFSKIGKVFSK